MGPQCTRMSLLIIYAKITNVIFSRITKGIWKQPQNYFLNTLKEISLLQIWLISNKKFKTNQGIVRIVGKFYWTMFTKVMKKNGGFTQIRIAKFLLSFKKGMNSIFPPKLI